MNDGRSASAPPGPIPVPLTHERRAMAGRDA